MLIAGSYDGTIRTWWIGEPLQIAPSEIYDLHKLQHLKLERHLINETSIDKNYFKNTKLLKIFFKSGEHISISPYSQEIMQDTRTSALCDKPSGVDYLGKDAYAFAIAKLIASNETETPLSIGIFAPWGEGKSTFTNLIKAQLGKLKNKNNFKAVKVVDFVAWKYNDQDQVWAGILQEIINQYEKESIDNNTYLNYRFSFLNPIFKKFWKQIGAFLNSPIPLICGIILFVICGIILFVIGVIPIRSL